MTSSARANTPGSASAAPATSTGVHTAAAGPRRARNSADVSGASFANGTPISCRVSTTSVLCPPPSDRIETPVPGGPHGCDPSVAATGSNSSVRVTSTTPAWAKPARRRSYGPAIAPVCESAA